MTTLDEAIRAVECREFDAERAANEAADYDREDWRYQGVEGYAQKELADGFEDGARFQHAQDQSDKVKLAKALRLALYYVEGDATYEGLCEQIKRTLEGE